MSQDKEFQRKASQSLQAAAEKALVTLRPFIGFGQLSALDALCRGVEGIFYLERLINIATLIENMPVTFEQRHDETDVAYLHYFSANSDWYILEKDIDGGVSQAYGYAIIDGDTRFAEFGYISISDLVSRCVELDLHFTPISLINLKKG
ncbi:hypothetical protein ACMYR3_16875 (plasmid) [Ampullimonas aquatilis]|uniref:hypothetical protein n=1 Tax=Ampullimonas aquatilis TaxID=1341549 RepID=UPI003C7502D5